MVIKTEKGRESERSFSPQLDLRASFGSFSKLSERVRHSVRKMTDKRNNENCAFVSYFWKKSKDGTSWWNNRYLLKHLCYLEVSAGEEGKATHSSILVWRISWSEEPGRLQSVGSQRVGHNWVTEHARSVLSILPVLAHLIFTTIT